MMSGWKKLTPVHGCILQRRWSTVAAVLARDSGGFLQPVGDTSIDRAIAVGFQAA